MRAVPARGGSPHHGEGQCQFDHAAEELLAAGVGHAAEELSAAGVACAAEELLAAGELLGAMCRWKASTSTYPCACMARLNALR